MQVHVYWIGKTRLPGVADLTEEYSKRLSRFCDFRAEEFRPGKKSKGNDTMEEQLLSRTESSFRIVLDPSGSRWSSEEFAVFIEKLKNRSQRLVTFCVGGADGFSSSFSRSAGQLLSLSPMTFPHELARVVLLEQIYRAFAILAHHPYPR